MHTSELTHCAFLHSPTSRSFHRRSKKKKRVHIDNYFCAAGSRQIRLNGKQVTSIQLAYDRWLPLGSGGHSAGRLCTALQIETYKQETHSKARDRLGANVCSNSIERQPRCSHSLSLWLTTLLNDMTTVCVCVREIRHNQIDFAAGPHINLS